MFTVSAVLNGTSVVSDELRLRVEKAISATGYKRNSVARSLKTSKTRTLGVLHIYNSKAFAAVSHIGVGACDVNPLPFAQPYHRPANRHRPIRIGDVENLQAVECAGHVIYPAACESCRVI